jgi:hypothetical protein
MIGLKSLISALGQYQHVVKGFWTMHEYFLTDVRLQSVKEQVLCRFLGNLGRPQIYHSGSKLSYIRLYRVCLTHGKQL